MAMRKIGMSCGLVMGLALASCAPSAPTEGQDAPEAAAATAEAEPFKAPSGKYVIDKTHASLFFQVSHMGLSNYVMRFTQFDADINVDAQDITKSSVVLRIDPKSIRADYPNDYMKTHADRGFRSWDEELALSGRFLNANEHKEITFTSTKIEQTGPNTARITGDLTLVGQTHPVTLDAKLIGSTDKHVMNGRGAFGIVATTTFDRTQFGMSAMGSGTVTLEFNAEFNEVEAPAAQ